MTRAAGSGDDTNKSGQNGQAAILAPPPVKGALGGRFRVARQVAANMAGAARRPRARALPALGVAVAVTVACAAGFSVLRAPAAPSGLQAQISNGEQVSTASQARPAAPAALPAASPARSPAQLRIRGRQVTAIGDSVMLASAMALHSMLPGIYIDAKVSRQMPAGLAVLRGLARAGRLRPVVVMGLGTNGIVTPSELSQLLRIIGPQRSLVLINTYVPDTWSPEDNATMAAFIHRHPGIVLADWYRRISHRTYLLWPDQVHPQLPGTWLYARMVYQAVQDTRHAPGPRPPALPLAAGQRR
jgi:hypothetical protein